MITVIIVLISLSLLVLFHEGGHFIFSRLSGITVEEFGLGYPPRAIGLTKIKKTGKWKLFFGKNIPQEEHSIIYSLNWIFFGGFNKIKGEEGESEAADNFYAKPWWQRFISLSGGVLMNVVLSIILFSICFMVGIPTAEEIKDLGKNAFIKETGVQIIYIQKNSPAEKAGLILGDMILKIDDQEIKKTTEIQDYLGKKVNQEVKIKIRRGERELDFKVIPQKAKEIFAKEDLEESILEKGVIGVRLAEVNVVSYPIHLAIWHGIKTTFITFWRIVEGVATILKELVIKQKMVGEAIGVIGIATFIGDAYQIGLVYLIQFVALISVAIAVCQLIPFPALDGGRLLFLIIEAIRGRAISRKTEALVHSIGFTLLILLMIFITYRDLMRLGERLFK